MITLCKCGWRVMHQHATRLTCPQCNEVIECDGLPPTIGAMDERIARIKSAAARTTRLKKWIAFFRIDGERGLGDTNHRLKKLAGKRAIKEDLRTIERACACETGEAIRRLNELHPYD